MKESIHFAHGNGFPSPCYQQLFKNLSNQFDYYYIDKVGHTEQYPVTDNWHNLSAEVIASITSQTTKPVIGLGHSLGGVLTYLAAIENPDLFRCIILLDSPIIGRVKSKALLLAKTLGIIDHLTPAYRTKGRRRHWRTREEARQYLKSKKLFKNFTEDCLEDYIDYGLEKDANGFTLRFDPYIEYQIYRTIPHVLHEYEGKLKVPAAIIYGKKSNVVNAGDIRYMGRKQGIKSFKTEGTHMFPMEYPEETATKIIKVIDQLL
ncbi:hydrolases or acyltransferases (alpha/beta hydrolase superfamily) (plasmid) [Legionella adelaidensis]|uniref:Hydrolase/acyltransferase n=1 Tax=Legionella adelaidensis TaxID=45056 RepID=A0A0W0R4J9_9GAMM|nr:alpha/beta hydrolase [Legionella adelaidensis]KTC65987.1 hydrolase/acyltransferase [Legionella adelaidensis]VEH86311.1 hydrolases or acyltransferases (alpha/beta hydrolase superfamily) [Legionella adelaidensis]